MLHLTVDIVETQLHLMILLLIHVRYVSCLAQRDIRIIMEVFANARDRASAVGIATRYGLDGPGIESWCGARFSGPVQTGPGAYPASCTMGTGSFPGVKRPGRGADHPPPFSVPRS